MVSVVDPDVTPPRVAFAIPRKVGPAVRRNRIRRQLRAHLPACSLEPGLHLVRVLPGAATLDGAALRAHLTRATSRSRAAA